MIRVINVLTDTNMGGAGTYILTFLENYDKDKVDMEVFIPPKSKLKAELEKRNVKYTEVPFINDKSFNIKAVMKLVKLFLSKKPDIVHTHAAMSARIAARLCGCKIIHTRHSVFDQSKRNTSFPVKNILGFINNTFSDGIIAVSPAAKLNLTDTGTSPKKIKVIMNGTSSVHKYSDNEKKEIRMKYNLLPSDFVVAIIARLEEIKGHDYVLDAAKILKGDSIKILIAGTGSYEKHLKDRASDEGIDNILFTGFISNISEIENIMDLQINASFGTEATSYSLLEGMSLGVPAVVSDFGGNPYVIVDGKNGLVVRKKDAGALAKAIKTLKENRQMYEKMCENAVADFEKRFTARHMTNQVLKLYNKFIPS